jgi:hypothetical protein
LDSYDASRLPKTVEAYFDELITRNHLDDTSAVRALVAAALTLALEPLSIEAMRV